MMLLIKRTCRGTQLLLYAEGMRRTHTTPPGTGDRLRRLRLECGATQPLFAAGIGVSLRALTDYETGKAEVPLTVALAAEARTGMLGYLVSRGGE